MSKAKALKPFQIKHALSVCKLMTHSQGKRCALVLSHSAMRVSEIALLETKYVVTKAGLIRREIHLPAAICKNLKPRTIWLGGSLIAEIIQDWIDYRKAKGWGTILDSEDYQGLNPDSRFLFSNKGRPYAMTVKKRTLVDGSVKEYKSSDALESSIRTVYKKAGLHQASSHSGRKSLVTNGIVKHGYSLAQMANLLGHNDEETTLIYVDIDQQRIAEMYEHAF